MYLPWQNLVAVLLLQKARILLRALHRRALPHLLLLALKSKSRQARAAFVIPCSLTRCHKSRVITDAQYDLRDGTWVYSTTDKTVHNRTKAKSALLHNWNRYGITSMCFNMPADGIVDDLKRVWCAGEITTAWKSNITTVPLLCDGFRQTSAEDHKQIASYWTPQQKQMLSSHGMEMQDVWLAYQWLQSDLVPLNMPRFGPVSGREDIVRGMLDRCGMLSRGLRGTVLSTGISFTSLLPSRARILIMSSADAESLSACEVFMLVLQAQLHVECAVVLNRKQMIRWKPFAYYLVVLLVRGIFNDHRFGRLLLTGLSAPGRSLELLTLVADPHFEFPSFDCDGQMHDVDDANAIMEDNDPLIEAYRSLVSVLAMPFSPLGSEGLQQKQVAEIAGRMHRYKDPATAAWRDDADDRGLEMDLDFEELACQQQSTMHSLSELPMEPLAFQDDGTASKFSM
eukprot:s3809_g5.t2